MDTVITCNAVMDTVITCYAVMDTVITYNAVMDTVITCNAVMDTVIKEGMWYLQSYPVTAPEHQPTILTAVRTRKIPDVNNCVLFIAFRIFS
jgi:hypothetical protein